MSDNIWSPFKTQHVAAVGPWLSTAVSCTYSDPEPPLDGPAQCALELVWTEYRARHSTAFNGQMLRLISIEGSEKQLNLIVNRTTYAHYVATRTPASEDEIESLRPANPIGVTVVAICSDDVVIATIRSPSADQNPGLAYFFGGYVEPPADSMLEDLIERTIARELTEELGICGDRAIVMGLANDPFFRHPELFAVTRLPISSRDVQHLWSTARDRHETTELRLLPLTMFLQAEPPLVPDGITWSFGAAAFLARHCWSQLAQL